MNIQTRILFGYGYLITLLLIAAGGAAVGFHDLGRTVGTVLAENFLSVRHAMEMLKSVGEFEGSIAASLLDETEADVDLAASEDAFLAALGDAKRNVTLPGERELLDALFAGFERYREARGRLMTERPDRPMQTYAREVRPLLDALAVDLLRLLQMNHRAMLEADQTLRERASDRATLLGLLVTLALLSLAFISRELQRVLLRRLQDLRSVAQAIAAGDRTRRAATMPADELGVVAAQLNQALDAEQQAEREMRGRLSQQRRILLALLAARDRPAAVIGLTGELVASTLDRKQTRIAERAAADLRRRDGPTLDEPVRSLEGWEIRFDELFAGGDTSCGFLVTVTPSAAAGE